MNLLAINWNVDPALFRIGGEDGFEIRYYGLFFAISFFLGYKIFSRIFTREGVSLKVLDKLLIWVLIATVVGARLGHVFFYEWDDYKDDLWRILNIREGGLASHGAAIAIVLTLIIFWRKMLKDKPMLWIFDRVAVPISLAGFFIRMGNLFNHEIMGVKTDVPWAFKFKYWPENPFNPGPFPRHPAQLYEALCYLAIFGLLWWLFFKKKMYRKTGFLFGLFLSLLFGARFLVEFVKEHQADAISEDSFLNMGQYLSIPLVLVGIYLMIRSFKHEEPDRAEKHKMKTVENGAGEGTENKPSES